MSIFRKKRVPTRLWLSNVQHEACFLGASPSLGLYLYFGIIQDSPWLAWNGSCWECQSGSKQAVCFGNYGVSVARRAADLRLHSRMDSPGCLSWVMASSYRAMIKLISVIPGIQMCDRDTQAPCYRCSILDAAEINIISILWCGWNNISRDRGDWVCHGLPVGSFSFFFPENRGRKPSLLMKGISTLAWTLVRKTEHVVCDGNLHQDSSEAKLRLWRQFSFSKMIGLHAIFPCLRRFPCMPCSTFYGHRVCKARRDSRTSVQSWAVPYRWQNVL